MPKKVSKKSKTNNTKYILAGVIVLIVGILGWLFYSRQQAPNIPLSRKVTLVAVDYIKQNKPPPTQAALEYAYLTTVYNKALQKDGQSAGLEAARQMLNIMYKNNQTKTNQSIDKLRSEYELGSLDSEQLQTSNSVIATYKKRWLNDGHTEVWKGTIPTGAGKWVKLTDKGPFTPLAGQWQRWGVHKAIRVSAPPTYRSTQDLKELAGVRRASASRDGDDVNKINFWGGTPGTETPSGIWLNQLYRTVEKELPKDHLAADKAYATTQQNLAQTISDAFMECWKVKYTYWTARPNMRDPSIKTAMPNPPFPSYISGHSTISKAAADVLSIMVPKHAEEWEAMAVEARDSRLVAGIHFNIDNVVGFQVGTSVADQIATSLKLSKQL